MGKNSKQKHRIVSRDGADCHWCGKRVPPHYRTVDHIIPRSRGGSNRLTNLVMACDVCNQRKANMDPIEFATMMRECTPEELDLRFNPAHKRMRKSIGHMLDNYLDSEDWDEDSKWNDAHISWLLRASVRFAKSPNSASVLLLAADRIDQLESLVEYLYDEVELQQPHELNAFCKLFQHRA